MVSDVDVTVTTFVKKVEGHYREFLTLWLDLTLHESKLSKVKYLKVHLSFNYDEKSKLETKFYLYE